MTIIPNYTVFIQIGIFLVLMVILDKVLFKPMLRILVERKARTQGRRERAAEAESKADEIWKDYQAKLAEARTGAEATRLELVRQGEAERQKVTDAATAEAEKTVSELRARVQAEAAEAQKALRAQVEILAKGMAEKILGRAV